MKSTFGRPEVQRPPYPKRIQRQRIKGWRMPPNTVYVGRPSRWGNPWRAGDVVEGVTIDATAAVALFRCYAVDENFGVRFDIERLRGKNLACYCPLGQPCHADVLLEIANE